MSYIENTHQSKPSDMVVCIHRTKLELADYIIQNKEEINDKLESANEQSKELS